MVNPMKHEVGTVIAVATILTVGDAAFYLAQRGVRLSVDQIRKLVDDGRLEAMLTPSGRRLIPESALERLVADRRAARLLAERSTAA